MPPGAKPKIAELVEIPPLNPDDPNEHPTRLRAEITDFEDGTRFYVFSERDDNPSPRWRNDPVALRTELVNGLTDFGNDPGAFRYFEYRGGARPFEEFIFDKDPVEEPPHPARTAEAPLAEAPASGKAPAEEPLHQEGGPMTYTHEQFGRLMDIHRNFGLGPDR